MFSRLPGLNSILRSLAFGFVVLTIYLVKTQYHLPPELDVIDSLSDSEMDEITSLEVKYTKPSVKKPEISRQKLVLFWTAYYGSPHFYKGSDRNPFTTCPVKNCQITNDRSLLNTSDAVVFHPFDLSLKDMPPLRFPYQRWIWFNLESPIYTTFHRHDLTVYDWTMTYHSQSEIYHPYGKVVPYRRKALPSAQTLPKGTIWTADLFQFRHMKETGNYDDTEVRFDLDSFVKAKTKGIAWVVSHCLTHSNRHLYVSELSKYIDVDIYGKCGSLSCARMGNCLENIGKEYKFYLAFENSVCVDYVTEKFFNSFRNGIVPVVFGVKAHERIAPPNSYVDARKFESPKALAEFLQVLVNNDTMYREYLRWNEDFKLNFSGGWCDLCKALNDPGILGRKVAHSSVNQWWFKENLCVQPIS